MKSIGTLIAAIALFTVVSVGLADDCRRIVYSPVAQVVQPSYSRSYVQPVAIATYYSPYYVSYAPQLSHLKELLSEVKSLRTEVQALHQPGPQVLSLKQSAVFVKACASCHDKAVAKGGIILTDGGQDAEIDALTLLKAANALTTQRMPKGSKLSDAEFSAVMSGIDGLTKQLVAVK